MPIKFDNVTYTYMKNTPLASGALREVSIEIAEGGFVGLIGRTGSGKSTLIQHMNGLLKPDEGNVSVDGISTSGGALRELRRKVGLVFQFPEYQLFEETVYKDIAYGISKRGYGEDEIDTRVRHAAQAVGIDGSMLLKSPFELSGGQKRRVAIAGVLVMEPKYLVMDEPGSGLDPAGREEIFRYVAQLRDDTGTCVILVSHNMDDVARLAARVIVMDGGRVIMDGAPKEVFTQIEAIEKAGLRAPDIQYLLRELKKTAPGIDIGASTASEAADSIWECIRHDKGLPGNKERIGRKSGA